MTRIDISRLDLQIHGIDAAVVRDALDRLPARLAAALQHGTTDAASDIGPVRVPGGSDPETLASAVAQRIAAVVSRRDRESA